MKDLWQRKMKIHFGCSRRVTHSLLEKCLGGNEDSDQEKAKVQKQQGQRSTVVSKPFARAHPAERPILLTKTMNPTTRHMGKRQRQERKERNFPNSVILPMETKVLHPMRPAKEKADSEKANPLDIGY